MKNIGRCKKSCKNTSFILILCENNRVEFTIKDNLFINKLSVMILHNFFFDDKKKKLMKTDAENYRITDRAMTIFFSY